MAASGDITVAQDGGNVKLHPYLVTLVRWCVSCLWSTATVLLHRLMTTPLQPLAGTKPSVKPVIPKRAAGTEHLHPEPRVECQILHQPSNHTVDVIFVHGLYGSLGNTWRQGDWRHKYSDDPQKVPLRNHSRPNTCNCHETSCNREFEDNKCDDSLTDLNDPEMTLKRINEKLAKKIIPKENDLITEQFYNNTLLDQDIDNYDTQANFVKDMFKRENDCDKCDDEQCDDENENEIDDFKCDNDVDYKCKYNEVDEFNHCKCNKDEKRCEVGCGCICNECYSTCWPKDWIKMDFPGARVISINYTSDPYLWRPLWIKENKRLNLYQRAEQMIEQLLEIGVGEKPIIWVGHSKGGLFIKQIYCEAYEAYLKTNKSDQKEVQKQINMRIDDKIETHNGITAESIDTIIGHFSHNTNDKNLNINRNYINDGHAKDNNDNESDDNFKDNNDNNSEDNLKDNNVIGCKFNFEDNNDNFSEDNYSNTKEDKYTNDYNKRNRMYVRNNEIANKNASVMNETSKYNNVFEQIHIAKNGSANNLEYININKDNCDINGKCNEFFKDNLEKGNEEITSSIEGVPAISRASLWSSSRGFMFYSVPHRGSPLADIKTPVTARSVDLLEIAKDCPLVLELQARWLRAYGAVRARAPVRSFVETCRTLMSVLWLRIVSTESADAGIGALTGISVDHREICKPSSRHCLLYTELTGLIREALMCKCQ